MKNKRKKLFAILCGLALCVLGISAFSYQYLPDIFEKMVSRSDLKKAGLQANALSLGDDVIEYAEGGKGSTIVFIHGYQGDKKYWLGYCKHLKHHYHLLLPDLPGHGGSSEPKNLKFDLFSLAQRVNLFIEAKGIKSFHLVGASMGGGIAAVYAAKYPEKVQSLTLINPFGVHPIKKSWFQKELDKGRNVMFPNNEVELDEFYQMLCGKPCGYASFYKKLILWKLKTKRTFYVKVFEDLISTQSVEEILPQIKSPTLLLFGEDDHVLHPSASAIFIKNLPHAELQILNKGSHVFIESCFEEAVNHLRSFLTKTEKNSRS